MSDMSSVTNNNYEAIKAQRDSLLTQRAQLIDRVRDLEERAVAAFLGNDDPGWYGTITTVDSKYMFQTQRFGPFESMVDVQAKLGEWMQQNREWCAFKVEYNAGEFTIGDPDEKLQMHRTT